MVGCNGKVGGRLSIVQSALSDSGVFPPVRDPAGGHIQFRATNHRQFGQRSAGARSAGVSLAVVYSSHTLFTHVRWIFLALPHTRVVYASLDLSGSAGQPTDAFDIFGRWVSAFSWRGVI